MTNIEEKLKEFDEKFPLVECSAHERTSSALCICEDLPDINEELIKIKSFLTQALSENDKKWRDAVEKAKINCPHDSRSHCMEEMCWVNEEGGYNQALNDLLNQMSKD